MSWFNAPTCCFSQNGAKICHVVVQLTVHGSPQQWSLHGSAVQWPFSDVSDARRLRGRFGRAFAGQAEQAAPELQQPQQQA